MADILQTDRVDDVVQSLLRARRGGPPANDHALQDRLTTEEQAYAVQERVYAALGDLNGFPRYWKAGAPSREEPLKYSPLPAAGVRPSGASVSDMCLRHTWIEAEVALRIGREVTPDEAEQFTQTNVRGLVDGICVSIEILDSRWMAERKSAPLLKLADFLLHGALILGDFTPFLPRIWDQQVCRVSVGNTERIFQGSLGVGDPAWVLPAWTRHATRNGTAIPANTVVSTGTWCGLLDAQRGDFVQVEFLGIGRTSVQL